jgi:molybdopterin converting factor small subunit
MAVKVMIPTPLRAFTEKKDAVLLEGKTVGELLGRLTTQHGQLKKHLYADNGTLRNFVNVYVNNEDIRYLKNEETPVSDSDVVSIIPSIAGGGSGQ